MGQHRAEHDATRRPASRGPQVTGRHVAPVPTRPARTALTTLRTSAVTRLPRSVPALPALPAALRRPLSVVPSVVGVAVLAVAGTGAVQSDSVDLPLQASAVSAATSAGVSGQEIVTDLGDRRTAISRDSERQALQEAADAQLDQAVEEQAAERNATLKSLARATEARAGELALNQWVLPTTNYRLTARFGQAGGMWSSNHTGLDFAAPSGTPIVSVAAGTVRETGYAGAYGNRTVITLDDGTEVWYCHQTSVDVQPGQKVGPGQRIGTVGTTGNSTGPHLHLEIRPGGGDPVDPYQALTVRGVTP